MAIPVLKLNLAPPPSFWRRQHLIVGWSALGLGLLALLIVGGLTWRAYHKADLEGQEAIRLSRQAQESLAQQSAIQNQLKAINVQKELPRWRLAERILVERSSPWSRLTAELERSLVQDVRVRGLQRSRGSDQQVVVKLKGEARTREAETAFVDSIHGNPYFAQMILERESERQGGGIEFEITLPLSATPPTYMPLPKYGPARKVAVTPKPVALPPVKPKPTATAVTPPVLPKATPGPSAPRPGITVDMGAQTTPTRPLRDPRPLDPEDQGPRRRPRALNRPDQEVRR